MFIFWNVNMDSFKGNISELEKAEKGDGRWAEVVVVDFEGVFHGEGSEEDILFFYFLEINNCFGGFLCVKDWEELD